ncbi:MAG: starch-binding protein [Bacilli bacterium]|nr:starch-binding protein [Bacilli bacterium]
MKRKSIFLLGSILAGAALVGGTFAAWAVTDSASPINVEITPGTIETGKTDYVTLEYGTRELINVEGLEPDQELGPYKLGLKATTGDAAAFAKGQLEVTLSEVAAADTLIDYVTVKVKEHDNPTNVIATLNSSALSYKGIPFASMTSGTEKVVDFYVSLASSAREVYSTIKTQKVNLAVDWNLADGEKTVESRVIYFDNHSNWVNVNAYAFGSAGEAKAWPGVAMTKVTSSIYSIKIDNAYDKVIFNNHNGVAATDQTADLTIVDSTPYYHYNTTSNKYEWIAAPDVSNIEYYLVGEFSNWQVQSDKKFVASTKVAEIEGNNVTFEYQVTGVAVTAGAGFKVVSTANDWFYKQGDANLNWTTNDAGTYNFYFKLAGFAGSDGTYYMYAEKVVS